MFAGRSDHPYQNVFHSYTFEVLPYWEEGRKRDIAERTSLPGYARSLGRSYLIAISELLQLNPDSKLGPFDF